MAGQDHLLAKGFLCTGAAAYVYGQAVVPVTGTALDPNQIIQATAVVTANVIGLCQENMDLVKVQTGKAYVSVALVGIAFGIADGAVAIGAKVVPSVTTAGQLHGTAATGNTQVGIAMSSATNAGDIFSVLLTPGVLIH